VSKSHRWAVLGVDAVSLHVWLCGRPDDAVQRGAAGFGPGKGPWRIGLKKLVKKMKVGGPWCVLLLFSFCGVVHICPWAQ
jgi:hypothetical protein